MKKSTSKTRLKIKKGEKIIIAVLAVLALMTPVMIVYSSACLSSTNIEVEKMKSKIQTQEDVNSSLSMQVDELASLSTIQEVAKEAGLSYNNDNIIVIK